MGRANVFFKYGDAFVYLVIWEVLKGVNTKQMVNHTRIHCSSPEPRPDGVPAERPRRLYESSMASKNPYVSIASCIVVIEHALHSSKRSSRYSVIALKGLDAQRSQQTRATFQPIGRSIIVEQFCSISSSPSSFVRIWKMLETYAAIVPG